MGERIQAEFIENFLVVWDTAKGSELYRQGYYGKPIGIPKPRVTEFDVPIILDLMEGLYLCEKKIISVHEGVKKKTTVNLNKLKQRAHSLYEDFDLKYAVYRDLREHGFIVAPGIKFGCDFAVYKRGPGMEHAPYMVSVRKADDHVTATDIVRTGRLATTVRKRFIIAVPESQTGKMRYIIFKWFKA